jgi:hypothetical protein
LSAPTRSRPATPGAATDIAAGALVCAGAAVLVLAAAAVAVALTGLGDDARRALRFGFGGVERTPGEALRLAIHNARFAAGTLLCAIAAPRLAARVRLLVDLMLASLLAFNAGLVGVALGAYGLRVAAATALHLPLEFTALSLAGGAYMSTSKQPLGARALAYVAAVCALLLAGAATLETYVSLGALR